MKKSILIILFSLFISSTFNSFSEGLGPAKEIELKAKLSRISRSLPTIPNLEVYINNGLVTIHFNEAVAREITVSVTCNGEELYREVVQVSEPMVLPVFIDINEDDACELEIVTNDWVLTGEL